MSAVAKIVVDLSLDKEFDYTVPPELAGTVRVGSRVVVPFGRREAWGYVIGFSDCASVDKVKTISAVVGQKALINDDVMELARWMADYYAAPVEQVIKTILPHAVRKKGARFKERFFVALDEKACTEEVCEQLRNKAPKQAMIVDMLRGTRGLYAHQVAKETGTSWAALTALEKKGLIKRTRQTEWRDPSGDHDVVPTAPLPLMPQQEAALKQIKESIDIRKPPVLLLHGVTGSGKTEIYLQAIAYALSRGKGAIVLVPEISLTPQMVERFRGRFGEHMAVLHSHLSEGERHDEWHRLHNGDARIAIGARSALFAPVKKLGLIVIDEEYEYTYKQEEAPRYHARDVAVMRGLRTSCAVLLGSATPSLESIENSRKGKYGLAELPHRVDHRSMPAIRIVDMRQQRGVDGKKGGVLSRDLINAIQERLYRTEQVILFLNRRGFATSLICPACGHVVECDHCSISMTYHKSAQRLKCHLCGAQRRVPDRCPNAECGDPAFKFAGMGTQRVEEVIARCFPKAKAQRMDADVTATQNAYERIFNDYRSGKIDILIGTQMIAKGLHFPNVTLVGVVFADTVLHMPDFRAGERTFQLLTQVAGRTGRGDVKGEVIVQTYTPFHPAIQAVRRMDFTGFMDQELEFRRELFYPPFCHLILVLLRGPSEETLIFSADLFMKSLRAEIGQSAMIAGPTAAPIAKIKGQYRYHVVVRTTSVQRVSEKLKGLLARFKWPPKIKCTVDVDALSLL